MHKYTASIIGARGYAGLVLAKILLRHPAVHLTHCFATNEFRLSQYIDVAGVEKVACLAEKEIEKNLTDIVFLATPAEVSLDLAPKLLAQGKKVIDLSGAFRLKKSDYNKWYGFTHTEQNTLQGSVYGLQPFVGPMSFLAPKEGLIANPGCYASAVLMALLPLIKENLIQLDSLVIDAKSGTTGAGRKATENMLFSEVDGECLPYKVGRHQHLPEIQEAVESLTGKKIEPFFTTSLLSVRRGIIAGIYAQLNDNITAQNVGEAFTKCYQDHPLVKVDLLKNRPELLSLKNVVGTARTHISYEVNGSKLYLFSLIDNLLKGAAGQAVENLNYILDLPVHTGLNAMEAVL